MGILRKALSPLGLAGLLAGILAGAAAAQQEPVQVAPLPGTATDGEALEEAAMLPGRVAVLQTLDKISARISTLSVPVGETVTWERLEISLARCDYSSPFERPERAALLRITEQRRGLVPVAVFSGWMFASSPALNALEHPIYDVILVDCLASAVSSDGGGNGTGSAD